MGACKVDTTKDARNLAVKYALNDVAGVRSLLRDRHRIANRRFAGDTAASDILIDLHSAIESAGLTDRQAEAVALVYGLDVTLETAGRVMGCTKQGVKAFVDEAAERVCAVYQRWEYGDVEIQLDADEAEVSA